MDKPSSTTTKLRVVFDSSAKTTSGLSFNDILLKGPPSYPKLTCIILHFRDFLIALTANISKMYLEILLDISWKDFYRFIIMQDNGKLEICT